MPSPTQRSLQYLRERGYLCHIVEKFLPARGTMKFPRRIDAFGFGDILAIRSASYGSLPEIALVQTTSVSSISARLAKIKALPAFKAWCDAGGIVIVHGWKKGKREPRTFRTMPTIRREGP